MSEATCRPLDQTAAIELATSQLNQLNNQLSELRARFLSRKQSSITQDADIYDLSAAQGSLGQLQQQLSASQERCQVLGKALASEVRSHGLTQAREEQATDALQAQQQALSSTLASLAWARQQLSSSRAKAAFLQGELSAAHKASAKQQCRAKSAVSALQQALDSTTLQLQQAREGAGQALVAAAAHKFAAARAQAECTALQQQLDLVCEQRHAASASHADLSSQLQQVLSDKAVLQQLMAELSQNLCDLQAHKTGSSPAPTPMSAPALTGQQPPDECMREQPSSRQLEGVLTHKPKPDEGHAVDEADMAVSDQAVRHLQLQQHLSIDICLQHDDASDTFPKQQQAQSAAAANNAASSAHVTSNGAAGSSMPHNAAAADAVLLPSPRALSMSRVWGSGLSTDSDRGSNDVLQQGFEFEGCKCTEGSNGSAHRPWGVAGDSSCSCPKQQGVGQGHDASANVTIVSELCDDADNSGSSKAGSRSRKLQGSSAGDWTLQALLHGTTGDHEAHEISWLEIIADMF